MSYRPRIGGGDHFALRHRSQQHAVHSPATPSAHDEEERETEGRLGDQSTRGALSKVNWASVTTFLVAIVVAGAVVMLIQPDLWEIMKQNVYSKHSYMSEERLFLYSTTGCDDASDAVKIMLELAGTSVLLQYVNTLYVLKLECRCQVQGSAGGTGLARQ